MLDDCGFEIYEENTFPLAYLLTFRTYGTWLHGDDRSSVDRHQNTQYGTPRREKNVPLHDRMISSLKQPPVIFDEQQRYIVRQAILEVCDYRSYLMRALNVRSNHSHAVVSRAVKPEKIVNDFKVYATRGLRDARLITPDGKVWSRGSSTRYLWKPSHVEAAVDYVKYCQEDIPFEFK